MNIIMVGPPASGKGTQASLLGSKLNLAHLSVGDLLRNAASDGKGGRIEKMKENIAKGGFASNELIAEIVPKEINRIKNYQGIILDGFPRSLDQAAMLATMPITIDLVINFNASVDVCVDRASKRRVHRASGRIYNTVTSPPRQNGIDDVTKEPLIKRGDDSEVVTRKRVNTFNKTTLPAIKKMKNALEGASYKWLELDANQDVKNMSEVISKYIDMHFAQANQVNQANKAKRKSRSHAKV